LKIVFAGSVPNKQTMIVDFNHYNVPRAIISIVSILKLNYPPIMRGSGATCLPVSGNPFLFQMAVPAFSIDVITYISNLAYRKNIGLPEICPAMNSECTQDIFFHNKTVSKVVPKISK